MPDSSLSSKYEGFNIVRNQSIALAIFQSTGNQKVGPFNFRARSSNKLVEEILCAILL
jgi:hypothetical protein